MGLWDTITDAVDSALDATDDYVFDTVDTLTAGAVNIDYDDGQFSVGTGVEGVATVGASVGDRGVTATADAIVGGNFDFGMTGNGLLLDGSAGIDWGPLPYASGHLEVDANGDVKVNGHVQGTIPTYAGIVSGEATGGFESTADGWGASLSSDGSFTTYTGVTYSGGEDFAYAEDADGSHLSAGVHGSVSWAGYGTVGGGVGYERVEHDGDVVEGVHAEGQVSGYGMSAGASVDYVHADVGGVESSDWSSDTDFQPPSLDSAAHTLASLASSELGGGDDAALGGAAGGLDAGNAMSSFDAGDAVDSMSSIGSMDLPPMDDFSQAIDDADAVQQSMDDLTQGLP